MTEDGERPSLGWSLVYAVVTAYGAALIFLLLIWIQAPAADEASRIGMLRSFFDPFVLTVMIPVGLISGLIAGGVTHVAVAGRHYGNAIRTVVGVVLAWIAVATLLSPGVSLAGILPVFAFALLLVRFVPWTRASLAA